MGEPVDILVVDDRPENLLALEATLDAPGRRLIKATTGAEALRAILQHQFAVILLDVLMPDMDGFETATLIRKHPRSEHTPIIFLTGFDSDREKMLAAYSLGAVDYLVKPFDPLLLTAKVQVFVELHREREKVRSETERRIRAETRVQQSARELAEREALLQRELETSAALTRATEELSRSNRELDKFASVASHDLQQPLRMITTYAGLLEREYGERLDDDGRTYLGFVVQGAKRMKETISGLLSYARIGTHDRSYVPVACNSVVEEVLETLSAEIDESNAKLTVEPLPTVRGDHVEIRRLFQNLVGNALKFRSARVPEIRIMAHQDGSVWRFCVADNGIGIDPRHHERVFDIFTRLHTYDEYEGTGIGLSECAKIVKHHGGTMSLESTLDEGARFYFTLPEAL